MGAKVKAGLILAACIGLGLMVGWSLHFTRFQSIVMAMSLCMLAAFIAAHVFGAELRLMATPACKLTAFAAFLVLLWASFGCNPTGGLTGHSLEPYFRFPRFLSMGLALLPAVPLGLAGIVDLLGGRAEEDE